MPATLFLLLALAFSGSAQTNAQNAREQITIPLSRPGKPFSLKFNFTRGSVNIVAYDGKDILISAEIEPEVMEKGEPNQNQNTNSNTNTNINRAPAVETQKIGYGGKYIGGMENDNNVTLQQLVVKRPLSVEIKLPRAHTTLTMIATLICNITMSGITGEIEIRNSNGPIQLNNISGSVIANTVSGNITANFKTVSPDAPMAFSTLVGNIDITFPASLKADVKIRSDNGQMYSDFLIEQDKNHPGAALRSQPTEQAGQAKYKIVANDWVNGVINGGGPEIMMKNMTGKISIRKG